MPEKMREATTLTYARLPLRLPTSVLEKRNTFSVTAPAFIILAAKINNGTAITIYFEYRLLTMLSEAIATSIPDSSMYKTVETKNPRGMGILTRNVSTIMIRNTRNGRFIVVTPKKYLRFFQINKLLSF